MNIFRPRLAPALVLALATTGWSAAWAQAATAPSTIYTCINAAGRKLTSDRPIPECNDREQRVLNSDGSMREIRSPSLTSEERAAAEELEGRRHQERVAKLEAIRRDRNLLSRYPNEPAHQKARAAALDVIKEGIKRSEDRVAQLQKERKPLADEAEFYVGKQQPMKLKQQIEAVDVSIEAQSAIAENQKVESQRIGALYDAELAHLKKLWAGAEPGSIGPPPAPGAVKAVASTSQASAPTPAPRKR